MLDINSCSHFSVFSHAILVKSTIYFRVVTKKIIFRYQEVMLWNNGNNISKVFDIFFCNNKDQVMIIKLRILYKQSRKESIFTS